MELLLVIFGFVITFSLLAVGELLILKQWGFDIAAHLRISHQSGKKTQFLLEAFGVIAFVIGQPILFTTLVVWAYTEMKPDFAMTLKSLPAMIGF